MSDAAEQIRKRMEAVRSHLGDDVEDVVDSAKDLVDWRAYVRRYPWASLGVAATVGYLVVPKRLELISPDTETLLELAKRNKLVVKPKLSAQSRGGAAEKIVTFVTHAALRGFLGYLGQKMGSAGGSQFTPADERES